MPPKIPDASSTPTESEVGDALESIDRELEELLSVRRAWVEKLSTPTSKNEAKDGLKRLVSAVADKSVDTAPNASVRAIDTGRSAKDPLTVAFLGPLGTYTHDAAVLQFGDAMAATPVDSFAEIFHAVESGSADYGVAPIENSTEGAVNQTHDLLINSDVQICAEVRLRIRHHLLSQAASLKEITSVHAHPQALAQCRQWLNKHLPGVELASESSNAQAAQLAADSRDGVAAIASVAAGERYGLSELAHGIEDISNNTTRFIVIGQHRSLPTGNDATSLLISAPHKPGGLRRMLQPLEDAGVSMTRIESRPGGTELWEYVFFIDVAAHSEDPSFAKVLDQLKQESPLVRVLGSYPRAIQ